jgi:hypothetical protein
MIGVPREKLRARIRGKQRGWMKSLLPGRKNVPA